MRYYSAAARGLRIDTLTITGTHIAYYHVCHRKLWLFANGINMEHTSDAVSEGKLIGETSYRGRAEKFTEIEIDGVIIPAKVSQCSGAK